MCNLSIPAVKTKPNQINGHAAMSGADWPVNRQSATDPIDGLAPMSSSRSV